MPKNNLNDLSTSEYFEKIGKAVIAAQERRRQINAQMHSAWLAEGRQLKATRKTANISQSEIAKNIGVDTSVIRRLERGFYVKRRPAIKAAYKLALEAVNLRRLNSVYTTIMLRPDDNTSSENSTAE